LVEIVAPYRRHAAVGGRWLSFLNPCRRDRSSWGRREQHRSFQIG